MPNNRVVTKIITRLRMRVFLYELLLVDTVADCYNLLVHWPMLRSVSLFKD